MTRSNQDPFGGSAFGGDPFGGGPGGMPAGAPPVDTAPHGTDSSVNTFATLSVIFAFVFAPVGVVLAHLGLRQIKRTKQPGRNRAITGLCLSYTIAVVLLLVALVGVTGWRTAVIEGQAVAEPADGATGGQPGLPLAGDRSGVVLGTVQDGGAAAIDLFIEPQCPPCGQFVERYGDQIKEHMSSHRLSVTVRPMTFLRKGSDDYSTRAINAIFLVAAGPSATPVQVWTFIQSFSAKFMATEQGLDDDALAQVANDVGADPNTVNRVAAGESIVDPYQVSDGNMALLRERGLVVGAPTVYDTVHDREVKVLDNPQWLDDLVR